MLGRAKILAAVGCMAALVAAPAWARGGHGGGGGGHGGGGHAGGGFHGGFSSGGFHGGGFVHGGGGFRAGTNFHGYHYVPGTFGSNGTYVAGNYAGSGSGVVYGPRSSVTFGYRPGWAGPRWGWGWGFGVPYGYTSWYAPAPAPVVVGEAVPVAPEPSPIRVVLGADGQLVQQGFGLGFDASIEGQRFGIVSNLNLLQAVAPDGSTNAVKLLDLHLSYALIRDEHGGLRVEAGADGVYGPFVAVGPGFGLSGGLALIGPLGLDAAVRVTPYPFHEVDGTAGLTLGLGPIGIRGGYRLTFLDDNGIVDGTSHQTELAGPYVGLALAL